jgi:PEGA domain
VASRIRLACAVLAASLAIASPELSRVARADPTAADKETARTLLDDGDRKFSAKDYAGALKSFQAADSMMGVPTTGIEVARAEEALGQLAEAHDKLLEVTRYPQKPGEPAAFTKARADAAVRAEKIGARIPTLKVTLSGPPGGTDITVTIDGETVPAAAATLPRKIDPGKHSVVASARGYADAKADVTLREVEAKEVKLTLVPGGPALGPPPPPPGMVPGGAPPPAYYGAPRQDAPSSPPEGTVVMKRNSTGMFVTGIVLMGVGGLTAIVGGLTMAVSSAGGSLCDDSGGGCGSGPSGTGIGILAAGGGLLVGGVVLTVIGGRKVPVQASASALTVQPLIGPGTLGMRGTF